MYDLFQRFRFLKVERRRQKHAWDLINRKRNTLQYKSLQFFLVYSLTFPPELYTDWGQFTYWRRGVWNCRRMWGRWIILASLWYHIKAGYFKNHSLERYSTKTKLNAVTNMPEDHWITEIARTQEFSLIQTQVLHQEQLYMSYLWQMPI